MPNTYAATNTKKFLDADGLAYFSQKLNSHTDEAIDDAIHQLKGMNDGLAELDSSGKIPASQLPSYVDDIVEYRDRDSFPLTGESGKLYFDETTEKIYRWTGSVYVEIPLSIALGSTAETAFRGDHGLEAYTHSLNKGSSFSSGLYKIATNSEGHVINAVPVVKEDIEALGCSGGNVDAITNEQIDVLFSS